MKPSLAGLQQSPLFNPPRDDFEEGYNDALQKLNPGKTTREYVTGYGVGRLDQMSR